MKLKPALLLSAFAGALAGATSAIADINVGVSICATGPGTALGIPERNTVALLSATIVADHFGHDARSRVLVRVENGDWKLLTEK